MLTKKILRGSSQERQASQYLFCTLTGMRPSSHDLLNLEPSHHQKFAVLIIVICCFYNVSPAKVGILFQTAKFFGIFFAFCTRIYYSILQGLSFVRYFVNRGIS